MHIAPQYPVFVLWVQLYKIIHEIFLGTDKSTVDFD